MSNPTKTINIIQLFFLFLVFVFLMGCSPKPDKPGSVAYLDFKNGIGEISLGSSVATLKELGFALDHVGESGACYTNDSFQITFGDFHLDNIELYCLSDRLVHISGKVNRINPSGDSDLLKFLTILFGEPTNAQKHKHIEDGIAVIDGVSYVWRGNKSELAVYYGFLVPLLNISDFHTEEAKEQADQAQREKKEKEKKKSESERMLKQNF